MGILNGNGICNWLMLSIPILLLSVLTQSAFAETGVITLSNVSYTSGNVQQSPYQITLTNFSVGTGTNRLLVVGINANNNNVTSVTFGQVPLKQTAYSFYNNDAEFWYLVDPNGTANIVVTMTGPTSAVVGAYSLSGVNQTNPVPTIASNHNTVASSPSISITTSYPNSWVLDMPSIYGGVTLGSPTCTQEWNVNMPDAITGASSSTNTSSPGTVTCNWTASSGESWDDVAIEVKAAETTPSQPQDIDEFMRSGGTPQFGEIQPILAESISVTPNSLGQILFKYLVPTSTNDNLGMIHCSDVRIHVKLDGTEVMVTDWLGYEGRQPPLPLDTGILTINSVTPVQHLLTLQPEGRNVGCDNQGYVNSWGGLAYIYDQ